MLYFLIKTFKKRLILRIQNRILLLGQKISPQDIIQGNLKCFLHNLKAILLPQKTLKNLAIEHPEQWEQLLKLDKLIFVGAHFGVFELLPQYFSAQNLKIHVPYAHQTILQRVWNFLRVHGRRSIQSIPLSKLPQHTRQWLKSNGKIALLADQGPEHTLIHLFNQASKVPLKLPALLRHSQWQVVFFNIHLVDKSYVLRWHLIDYQDSIHQGYGKFLEESIRQNPCQWVWHYPNHFLKLPQFKKSPKKGA